MFNETSYPAGGPKLAWQGRRGTRPEAIGARGDDDRFYAPGYGPGVVESPGFMAPGPPQIAPAAETPSAVTPAAASSGGIMESIGALPTWMLLAGAGAAWFFFFRKGR